MTTNPHDLPENSGESAPDSAAPAPGLDTYEGAIEAYLAAASWLSPSDAPLRVHARSIAKSLDRQMLTGEIQSALASSFDKVLLRLDARRPVAPPPDPLVAGVGPHGEASLFAPMGE